MVNKKLSILILVFVAGLAFYSGSLLNEEKTVKVFDPSLEELEFPLINKAVTAGVGKHFIINFKSLKDSLIEIKSKYPQKTYIFFDYLNNASWVGLDEREEFTAASTIKVPLAMSLMKAVETNKVSLSDVYSLDDLDLNESFGELYKFGSGEEFQVGDLMDIMLKYSDNTAMFAILSVFKKIGVDDPFFDVYNAIGWEVGGERMFSGIGQALNYQKINLKTLANMFVALYNAKYINVENSSLILDLLSKTEFDEKIASGVPSGVVVSHKVGISETDRTFSDCGIIYPPNRHYILCLGSSGGSEDLSNKFMKEVSKTVYDYVINN